MEDLENGNSQTHQSDPHLHQSSFEPTSSHDDFLEQMLSTLPNCSWPDLSSSSNSNPNPNSLHQSIKPQGDSDDAQQPGSDHPVSFHVNGNSSSMAAAAKSFLLQQQMLLSSGVGGDSGLIPLPLSLSCTGDSLDSRLHDMVTDGPSFKSTPQGAADGSVQALFNGFPGPPHGGNGQTTSQQPFQAGAMPAQNFGAPGPAMGTGSTGQAPQRQRVRARRGQATDPHSIAERLRRERIAERMKALQELVPNGNKTDKASMLDEIIDYVKFLQLQVKVLSMSRLGGASAAAPRVADLSAEGGRSSNNGNPGVGSSNDGMSVTEHQVVKLMEEDMGSAMQYLQGKGLCLMPISLATAISTATCNTRNSGSLHNNNHRHHHPPPPPPSNIPPLIGNGGGDGPSSPNLSGLTVQSANLVNGDVSIKDSNPPSKA